MLCYVMFCHVMLCYSMYIVCIYFDVVFTNKLDDFGWSETTISLNLGERICQANLPYAVCLGRLYPAFLKPKNHVCNALGSTLDNRCFKSRKASHSSYRKNMSTSSKIRKHQGGQKWKKNSNFGESKKVRCTVYSTCICIFSSKPRPEPAKPGIPNSGAIACEAVWCSLRTELGGSESRNVLGHAGTITLFWLWQEVITVFFVRFFSIFGGPRILTVWSKFPKRKGFPGFP